VRIPLGESVEVETMISGDAVGGRPLRLVLVGLGAIGADALEEATRSRRLSIAAVVDPLYAGSVVSDVRVRASLTDCGDVDADVALVATGSSFPALFELVLLALRRGYNVVSTCEELAYPWAKYPEESTRLDEFARIRGKVVLGCGVNPGFVMDALPVMVIGGSLRVTSLECVRRVDLSRRRRQLREKLGVGLPEHEWYRTADQKEYGHRGLIESALLCATGLGWHVEAVTFARSAITRGPPGDVRGVAETAVVSADGGRTVRLDLSFEIDGEDYDSVRADGEPPLHITVEDGTHGDKGTVARMLNCARLIGVLAPGLRLPIEVPPWAPSDPHNPLASNPWMARSRGFGRS
jgi:hypothetical protein